MKKLILILATVLLVGCSQDEERNVNNESFTIPDLLIGYHEKQNSNFFLDIEKHKVTFNNLEGETIVITEATQMAFGETYTTLAFDDKIILIELIGGGAVSMDYVYNGGERIFFYYYARQ